MRRIVLLLMAVLLVLLPAVLATQTTLPVSMGDGNDVRIGDADYRLCIGSLEDGSWSIEHMIQAVCGPTDSAVFSCYVLLLQQGNHLEDAPREAYEAFWAQCDIVMDPYQDREGVQIGELTTDADGYHKYYTVTMAGEHDTDLYLHVTMKADQSEHMFQGYGHVTSLVPQTAEVVDGQTQIVLTQETGQYNQCYQVALNNNGEEVLVSASFGDGQYGTIQQLMGQKNYLWVCWEDSPAPTVRTVVTSKQDVVLLLNGYSAEDMVCTIRTVPTADRIILSGGKVVFNGTSYDLVLGGYYNGGLSGQSYSNTILEPEAVSAFECYVLLKEASSWTEAPQEVYDAFWAQCNVEASLTVPSEDAEIGNPTVMAGCRAKCIPLMLKGSYTGNIQIDVTMKDGTPGVAYNSHKISVVLSEKDRITFDGKYASFMVNGDRYELCLGAYTKGGFSQNGPVKAILSENETSNFRYYLMLADANYHEAPEAIYDLFWEQCNVDVSLAYEGTMPQTGTATVGELMTEEGRLGWYAPITITGEFTGHFWVDVTRKDDPSSSTQQGNMLNVGLAQEVTLDSNGSAVVTIDDPAYLGVYYYYVDLGEHENPKVVTAEINGDRHGFIRSSANDYFWRRYRGSSVADKFEKYYANRYVLFAIDLFDEFAEGEQVAFTISAQEIQPQVWVRLMSYDNTVGQYYEDVSVEPYAASLLSHRAGNGGWYRLHFGRTEKDMEPLLGGNLTTSDSWIISVAELTDRDGVPFHYMMFRHPGTATLTYTPLDGDPISWEWTVTERNCGFYNAPIREEAHYLEGIYWNSVPQDAEGKRWVWYLERDGITEEEKSSFRAVDEDGIELEVRWEQDKKSDSWMMKICVPSCGEKARYSFWAIHDTERRRGIPVFNAVGSDALSMQPAVVPDTEQPNTYQIDVTVQRNLSGTESCKVAAAGYDENGCLQCIDMTGLLQAGGETDSGSLTLTSQVKIVEIRLFTVSEESAPLLSMLPIPVS